MAGRQPNRKSTVESIKVLLDEGRSVTTNPKHHSWIVRGLEQAGLLLEVWETNGVWKIKKRNRVREDIQLDIPMHEIKSYCIDQGVVIYPIPANTQEYELVIERRGLVEKDPGHWKKNPKPNDGKWEDRVELLYKNEYIKLLVE